MGGRDSPIEKIIDDRDMPIDVQIRNASHLLVVVPISLYKSGVRSACSRIEPLPARAQKPGKDAFGSAVEMVMLKRSEHLAEIGRRESRDSRDWRALLQHRSHIKKTRTHRRGKTIRWM